MSGPSDFGCGITPSYATVVNAVFCRDRGHDCDFAVQTDNDDELVHHVQDHAERIHDVELSCADVEDPITEAEA